MAAPKFTPPPDSSEDLRERLLLAAARAYIEANRLPEDPDRYALHLERQWETDPRAVPDGAKVSIPLRDLLAAAAMIRDGAQARRDAKQAQREVQDFYGAWQAAKTILRAPAPREWKSRAMGALRALKLTGAPDDPLASENYWRDRALRRRWGELTEGLFDHESRTQHPKLSNIAALEEIGREFYPEAKDPTAAARQALHRAGVRNLPRVS